jgi:hypothetical protein
MASIVIARMIAEAGASFEKQRGGCRARFGILCLCCGDGVWYKFGL